MKGGGYKIPFLGNYLQINYRYYKYRYYRYYIYTTKTTDTTDILQSTDFTNTDTMLAGYSITNLY